MAKKKDLVGKKYSKLLVIEELQERNRQGSVQWLCKCDCGTFLNATTGSLNSGNTKSCGCARKDSLDKRNRKHSLANSRIYRIWAAILTRCSNENSEQYPRYGGRGIKVCERWSESFENFHLDMNSGYSEEMTLERKDVNGNYCPENCEWILKKDQALNKGRYKNNKSGYTGISEQERKYGLTLVATIQNPKTGKPVIKTRNLLKFSREQALKELLLWLEDKRHEFGYKKTHGTD